LGGGEGAAPRMSVPLSSRAALPSLTHPTKCIMAQCPFYPSARCHNPSPPSPTPPRASWYDVPSTRQRDGISTASGPQRRNRPSTRTHYLAFLHWRMAVVTSFQAVAGATGDVLSELWGYLIDCLFIRGLPGS
jgi:hypothetical protein